MIGNISSILNNHTTMTIEAGIAKSDLSILSDFSEAKHVLKGGDKFIELDNYINISQFRIYCTKPSTGRVIHIVTGLNKAGLMFRDYLLGRSDEWLTTQFSCRSGYVALPDDTSILKTKECQPYGDFPDYERSVTY